MNIFTIVVSPFAQNARVLVSGNRAVIIDPGADAERILAVLDLRVITVESVFLTHSHLDHVGGVMALYRLLAAVGQCPVLYGHCLGQSMREHVKMQGEMYGWLDCENVREPDIYVGDGDMLSFDSYVFRVLFTPGHSPDHLCLFADAINGRPLLIAGDALFSGAIGRTDLPGGDSAVLLRSIHESLLVLPNETVVMCGHGADTTIGVERGSNPFLI